MEVDDKFVFHKMFNKLSLKKLSLQENNFLFFLLTRMCDEGLERIEIPFNSVYEKINRKTIETPPTVSFVEVFNKKIKEIPFAKYEDPVEYMLSDLFSVIKTENRVIYCEINEKFFEYFNNLNYDETSVVIEDYIYLRSKYSKSLMRMLEETMDYNGFIIDFARFKHILGVPMSYKTSKVRAQTLTNSLEELDSIYPSLEVKEENHPKNRDKLNKITLFFNENKKKENEEKTLEEKYIDVPESRDETLDDWDGSVID